MHEMLYLIKPGLIIFSCIALSFLLALIVRGSWIPGVIVYRNAGRPRFVRPAPPDSGTSLEPCS